MRVTFKYTRNTPIGYQRNRTINITYTKKYEHDYRTCLPDASQQVQEKTRETYWFCVLNIVEVLMPRATM